jgi:hypothetical protein
VVRPELERHVPRSLLGRLLKNSSLNAERKT